MSKTKINQGGRGKYSQQILKLSSGLFYTLADICLFSLFFTFKWRGTYRSNKDLFDAIAESIHLTKITNAYNLKRVIYKLTNKGYLERKQDFLKITQLGKERLNRFLPQYEKNRPWDGLLYLIIYDIPESRKKDRDYLRNYLQKLSCGMLQHSVWLTPYNPKRLIADLVKNTGLVDLVLVSELKEGSGIGGRNIKEAVRRVYKLDQINKEYREFNWAVEKGKIKGKQLILKYLGILKKDPQLPFELLPPEWAGEDAYEDYFQELQRLSVSYSHRGRAANRTQG